MASFNELPNELLDIIIHYVSEPPPRPYADRPIPPGRRLIKYWKCFLGLRLLNRSLTAHPLLTEHLRLKARYPTFSEQGLQRMSAISQHPAARLAITAIHFNVEADFIQKPRDRRGIESMINDGRAKQTLESVLRNLPNCKELSLHTTWVRGAEDRYGRPARSSVNCQVVFNTFFDALASSGLKPGTLSLSVNTEENSLGICENVAASLPGAFESLTTLKLAVKKWGLGESERSVLDSSLGIVRFLQTTPTAQIKTLTLILPGDGYGRSLLSSLGDTTQFTALEHVDISSLGLLDEELHGFLSPSVRSLSKICVNRLDNPDTTGDRIPHGYDEFRRRLQDQGFHAQIKLVSYQSRDWCR